MTNIGNIALILIHVRDQLKFYHWSTKYIARHTASDTFVTSLSDKTDRLIEVIQGSEGKRIELPIVNFEFKNESDDSIIRVLENFKRWLSYDFPNYLNKNIPNTDILNIRDEILADVNNTLYLFTFS